MTHEQRFALEALLARDPEPSCATIAAALNLPPRGHKWWPVASELRARGYSKHCRGKPTAYYWTRRVVVKGRHRS